jgi:hypothetical protein
VARHAFVTPPWMLSLRSIAIKSARSLSAHLQRFEGE